MSFYDLKPNFYGNPGQSAMPMRTDAMRDSRQQFRQLRNQGVIGQGSTLNARMGDMNVQDVNLQNGPRDPAANRAILQGLRQDVNRNGNANYGTYPGSMQPTYSTPDGIAAQGMAAARQEDLKAFRDSLNNQFKNPGQSGGLMPLAPSWMSSDRANNIMKNVSGRYNNSLPFNANPYQQTMSKQKGQPT